MIKKYRMVIRNFDIIGSNNIEVGSKNVYHFDLTKVLDRIRFFIFKLFNKEYR